MSIENPAYPDAERTICIDFDGVIHDSYDGYGDGTIYGDMIADSEKSLEILSKTFKIVILTCKAREDRPLVKGKTGKDLVIEWLKKYNIYDYVSDVTAIKPPAKYYIDDKAITFINNWPAVVMAIIGKEYE